MEHKGGKSHLRATLDIDNCTFDLILAVDVLRTCKHDVILLALLLEARCGLVLDDPVDGRCLRAPCAQHRSPRQRCAPTCSGHLHRSLGRRRVSTNKLQRTPGHFHDTTDPARRAHDLINFSIFD